MAWSIALPREVFTSPILSVTAPTTVGMLVGYLVNRAGKTKGTYKSLHKPAFYPPAWLFAPMWTVLYGAMGYAAHHATGAGYSALTSSSSSSTAAQSLGTNWETLYTTQLALNYLWMPLFFGLRRPAWALADILLLGGNVAALMHTWWKTDRTAFWLMVPYAGWLAFATYLNAGVGVLNKWTIGEKPKDQ